MSTQSRAASAFIPAKLRTRFRSCGPACALAVVGTLLLSGCTGSERSLVAGPDPSDPGVPVPTVRHRTTTAGYVSLRPVPPAAWRRQNERAAPKPKSEQ